MKCKEIAILGSTGSIGRQTLDVCRLYPERFHPYALSANTSVEELISQAREFMPEVVCIANEAYYERLREGLSDLPIKIYAGSAGLRDMVTAADIDVVVAAMVGFAGLEPTVAAIKAGKTIALANKETLVVAGELICRLVSEYNSRLIPVDSEHSAIFQSLSGEDIDAVDSLLLTASGGPFRTFSKEQMLHVTAANALRHPNWSMGDKITIDSATMMNKGFEIIEAQWLFGINSERIEVLVHPESVIHSAVRFVDGSVKAQLAIPDMRLPIQYALTYPERIPTATPPLDLFAVADLHFEQADTQRFPCLKLAREAIIAAAGAPCILNAANEVANKAFRDNKITFYDIATTIEYTLQHVVDSKPCELPDYIALHNVATHVAQGFINKFN